jgi:hypothetical protein
MWVAVGVLAGCGSSAGSSAAPLRGQLTVLVRPPDRTLEPVSIAEPGSLPVQSGGAMCLDARLEEPAYIFIVWVDSGGTIVPLYPWNNESVEVTDADQPPPERRATKLVFSPLLGRNWTFGNQPGTETLLLLARRTPLPKETRIGQLLDDFAKSRPAVAGSETVNMVYDAATKTATNVASKSGGEKESTGSEGAQPPEPLRERLARLGEHFELVQVVQFAHRETGTGAGKAE